MPASAVGYERWLRCAAKTCCTYYAVFPTGDEIVTIARTLGMPIDEVVVPLPSAARPTAYQSGPNDAPHRLALVRTRNDALAPATCGFLVQLPDGAARCGLGALRPRRCQIYPAVVRDGRLDVDAAGCSCGPWHETDVASGAEARLLDASVDAYTRYTEVVRAWNTRRGPSSTHADFFDFLRAAYRA